MLHATHLECTFNLILVCAVNCSQNFFGNFLLHKSEVNLFILGNDAKRTKTCCWHESYGGSAKKKKLFLVSY